MKRASGQERCSLSYTKQRLTLRGTLHDEVLNPVAARVASNGLAYCVTPFLDGVIVRDFTVTHAASGYALCFATIGFQSADQCRRFIALADRLADWTQSEEEIRKREQDVLPASRKIARYVRR
jgi:hypothetical protein